MYFHSQNLKKEDKEKGLIHWRCWIGQQPELTFYISSPSSFWHIDIDLCENGWQEEAIGFSIASPLLYIAIGLRHRKLYDFLEKITRRKGQKYTNGRTIGVKYHSGKFWFNLWEDPMESRSIDPWWWHFTFDPIELLFGRRKYSEETLQEGDTVIEMPEGVYKATYKKLVSSWKRPRSFFTKKLLRISVDIPVGIPHEGKGENSWDCGMDATFGVTMPIGYNETIGEVCQRIAVDNLKTRQKYGPLESPEYLKWKQEG